MTRRIGGQNINLSTLNILSLGNNLMIAFLPTPTVSGLRGSEMAKSKTIIQPPGLRTLLHSLAIAERTLPSITEEKTVEAPHKSIEQSGQGNWQLLPKRKSKLI